MKTLTIYLGRDVGPSLALLCLGADRIAVVAFVGQNDSRAGLRYKTDLTDAQWRLIAPFLPAPKATGRHGRWPLREILNTIFHVLRGGSGWRLLPSDMPPRSTVYRWLVIWRDTSLLERLNHILLRVDRERVGRQAWPSAGVIDSQSVKTT